MTSPPISPSINKMTNKHLISIAAILSAILATNDNFPTNRNHIKLDWQPLIMMLDMLNFISKIVNISNKAIENQYSRIKQQNRNKTMHAMNGNRYNKTKIKSHLKIAQINKGNSEAE